MKFLKLFETFNTDGKVNAANMVWFTYSIVRKISKLKKIVDEKGNSYYYLEMDKYEERDNKIGDNTIEWKNKGYKLILFHKKYPESVLDFDSRYIYEPFNSDIVRLRLCLVLKKLFKRDCDSGFRPKNVDYFKELIKMKYRDL